MSARWEFVVRLRLKSGVEYADKYEIGWRRKGTSTVSFRRFF